MTIIFATQYGDISLDATNASSAFFGGTAPGTSDTVILLLQTVGTGPFTCGASVTFLLLSLYDYLRPNDGVTITANISGMEFLDDSLATNSLTITGDCFTTPGQGWLSNGYTTINGSLMCGGANAVSGLRTGTNSVLTCSNILACGYSTGITNGGTITGNIHAIGMPGPSKHYDNTGVISAVALAGWPQLPVIPTQYGDISILDTTNNSSAWFGAATLPGTTDTVYLPYQLVGSGYTCSTNFSTGYIIISAKAFNGGWEVDLTPTDGVTITANISGMEFLDDSLATNSLTITGDCFTTPGQGWLSNGYTTINGSLVGGGSRCTPYGIDIERSLNAYAVVGMSGSSDGVYIGSSCTADAVFGSTFISNCRGVTVAGTIVASAIYGDSSHTAGIGFNGYQYADIACGNIVGYSNGGTGAVVNCSLTNIHGIGSTPVDVEGNGSVTGVEIDNWPVGGSCDYPLETNVKAGVDYDNGSMTGTLTASGTGPWPTTATSVGPFDVGTDNVGPFNVN
jgi:hypothetical protein